MVSDLTIALSLPADEAAARLLGSRLLRRVNDRVIEGRIVETESYDQSDVASHSYRGQTARTKVMFGPAGYLYVYFTYGLHYCCNVVVGAEGHGAAVLIRALEPIKGQELMQAWRGGRPELELTNGPAKVCQALAIDKALNGHDLSQQPLILKLGPMPKAEDVVQTTRIGISRAQDVPWRFYLKGNPY